MSEDQITNELISYIEDCFNMPPVTIHEQSTLADFSPDELDLTLFCTEVDLDFNVDLEQIYGDKLLNTPIFEIAGYIENKINKE
jgi:hypothetical protein